MIALASFLALAVAAPQPLERCHASAVDFHGWEYFCGDVAVKVVDDTAPFTPEYRRGQELAIGAILGEGVAQERTRIQLGGRQVDAVRTTRSDGRRTAWVVSRRRPEGERMLVCFGSGDGSSCLPVLELLEVSAWRSGPVGGARRVDTGALELAGRSVPIPDGCTAERATSGGSVVCGATSFVNWIETTDEAPARRRAEAMSTMASENFRKTGTEVSRDELACSVAGIPSTCERFRAHVGGERLVVIVGLVHGETWAAASCTAMGSSPSLSSGACGAVFAER